VISFTPGREAEIEQDVMVTVTPSMTVESVKDEIVSQCGIMTFNKAVRLMNGGLHMDEDRTVEQYHVDPEATLHLIVPRSAGKGAADGLTSTNISKPSRLSQEKDSDESTDAGSSHYKSDDSSRTDSSSNDVIRTDSSKRNQNITFTAASFRSPGRCSSLRRSASVSGMCGNETTTEETVSPSTTEVQEAPSSETAAVLHSVLGRPPRPRTQPAHPSIVVRRPRSSLRLPPTPPCQARLNMAEMSINGSSRLSLLVSDAVCLPHEFHLAKPQESPRNDGPIIPGGPGGPGGPAAVESQIAKGRRPEGPRPAARRPCMRLQHNRARSVNAAIDRWAGRINC